MGRDREEAVVHEVGAPTGERPSPPCEEVGPLPITAIRSARLIGRDRQTSGALDHRSIGNVGLVADLK